MGDISVAKIKKKKSFAGRYITIVKERYQTDFLFMLFSCIKFDIGFACTYICCLFVQLSSLQNQMKSKGGYDHTSPVDIHLNVVDLPDRNNRQVCQYLTCKHLYCKHLNCKHLNEVDIPDRNNRQVCKLLYLSCCILPCFPLSCN